MEGHLEEGDYLVASGKLSLGIPTDFYVQVSEIVKRKKARFVLDTSGEALLPSMKSDIFLMKPNLAELSKLCGVESIYVLELESLAQKFLKDNSVELLVVSLGAKGAFLATKDRMGHITAPTVHQKVPLVRARAWSPVWFSALRKTNRMAKWCGTGLLAVRPPPFIPAHSFAKKKIPTNFTNACRRKC